MPELGAIQDSHRGKEPRRVGGIDESEIKFVNGPVHVWH
jgi:hypothetical protein